MIQKLRAETYPTKLYFFYSIALGFLFISSLVISKGNVVLLINGHYTVWSDYFFRLITNLGDGVIFVPITILLLFIRFEYAVMSVFICGVSGAMVSLFKQLLFSGLERPAKVLDQSLLHFVPGVEVHTINSFPSGHTTTAFCAALFISLIFRNRIVSLISLTLALLVAYSRIYLLQHFLIDVAAGAVIGSFSVYLVWEIFSHAPNKPFWMGSHLSLRLYVRNKESVTSHH